MSKMLNDKQLRKMRKTTREMIMKIGEKYGYNQIDVSFKKEKCTRFRWTRVPLMWIKFTISEHFIAFPMRYKRMIVEESFKRMHGLLTPNDEFQSRKMTKTMNTDLARELFIQLYPGKSSDDNQLTLDIYSKLFEDTKYMAAKMGIAIVGVSSKRFDTSSYPLLNTIVINISQEQLDSFSDRDFDAIVNAEIVECVDYRKEILA